MRGRAQTRVKERARGITGKINIYHAKKKKNGLYDSCDLKCQYLPRKKALHVTLKKRQFATYLDAILNLRGFISTGWEGEGRGWEERGGGGLFSIAE